MLKLKYLSEIKKNEKKFDLAQQFNKRLKPFKRFLLCHHHFILNFAERMFQKKYFFKYFYVIDYYMTAQKNK